MDILQLCVTAIEVCSPSFAAIPPGPGAVTVTCFHFLGLCLGAAMTVTITDSDYLQL